MVQTNEKIYDLICLGKSFEETIAGDTKSFTLKYIDWENIENNVFHNCAQTAGSRSAVLMGLATDTFTTGSHGDAADQAAMLEVDLLEKIKAAGVEVNEADKQAFIDASGAIYEEFAGSVDGGAELVETAQGLAN